MLVNELRFGKTCEALVFPSSPRARMRSAPPCCGHCVGHGRRVQHVRQQRFRCPVGEAVPVGSSICGSRAGRSTKHAWRSSHRTSGTHDHHRTHRGGPSPHPQEPVAPEDAQKYTPAADRSWEVGGGRGRGGQQDAVSTQTPSPQPRFAACGDAPEICKIEKVPLLRRGPG